MIQGLARFTGCCYRTWSTEKVPPWRQLQDFRFFRRVTRMSAAEFHRYRLWDRRRSIEERLAFLSHLEHRLIERVVNPTAAVRALNNKILTAKRLARAGILMPEMLGSIDTGSAGGAAKPVAVIAAELRSILATGYPRGVVIKPNQGQGGEDVFIFRRADADGVAGLDGSLLTIDAAASLLAQHQSSSWKVERRLCPHPALARVAQHSLSTLRVLTFRSPQGEIHVGPASLKLPIGHSGVDNFGAGNLAAAVELATGRVGSAVRIAGGVRVAVHPTSGERIETLIIPELEAVTDLVTAAATEMRELTVLGWDVALTPEGPMILEGNAWWGTEVVQMPQDQGLVCGRFAELLEAHGLGELLRRRERGAAEWNHRHPAQG